MFRGLSSRAVVPLFVLSVTLLGTSGIAAGPLLIDDFGKGDERTKGGDDYAARVYVVFPSTLFWRTRAVNYIWANRLPRGAFLPNAYTGNAVMVAVESGDGNAGRWIDEERDLAEDYRRAFGEDPPRIGAVAIMTDTDNTGEEAVAWYGAIRFLPPNL